MRTQTAVFEVKRQTTEKVEDRNLVEVKKISK